MKCFVANCLKQLILVDSVSVDGLISTMEFNIRGIIVWLIIIYNITFLTCAVKSPLKEFEINLKGQSNLRWNKRLRNANISQRFSVSLLECVDECFNISTCKSFNYKRNLPLCELNYQSEEINRPTMLDPVVMTDENNFIYGDIKYWGMIITNCSIRIYQCFCYTNINSSAFEFRTVSQFFELDQFLCR